MKERLHRILDNCPATLQAIILKNGGENDIDENFFYLTGLHQGLFEGAYAILHSDKTVDIITSELEAQTAQKTKAQIHISKKKADTEQHLKEICAHDTVIGLNFQKISYTDFCTLQKLFPNVDFIDISESLIKTRLVKDKQEIRYIQKACTIADSVMEKIPSFVKEGMKEFELAAEINYHLQKAGAEKPAFTTISSFAKNTAEPHYSHGETRLKNKDFIICDFGACYYRYNSDITRAFVFGKATEQQKKMYSTVLTAQQNALEMIKPEIPAYAIHEIVSTVINKTEFKGFFIHSTGHSLGLAVHDGPGFSQDNMQLLQENMVVTIEPGIYIPKLGGVRIEDDILITKQGVELLTKSPKDIFEL